MSTSANGGRGDSALIHKSIEALLAAYPGEGKANNIIRRLAREKVAYAKEHLWSGPPFCPKEFTSLFGYKCQEVSHDIVGDGRILLGRDGRFKIEYRDGHLPERQRFTIFHEFAHTLFPDFPQYLPQYYASQKNNPDPVKEFERLCDFGASEMLFPLEEFTSDLTKLKHLGIEAVHQLRERYKASIEATIYRIMFVESAVGFASVFLTDQRGTNAGYGPLWVKYSNKNALFNGYVPSGITPPSSSVTVQCFRKNLATTDAVKETWWINGKPRSWLVQAARLPTISGDANYPKVVALVFPASYAKTRETGE
jgi:hypothetical protein